MVLEENIVDEDVQVRDPQLSPLAVVGVLAPLVRDVVVDPIVPVAALEQDGVVEQIAPDDLFDEKAPADLAAGPSKGLPFKKRSLNIG